MKILAIGAHPIACIDCGHILNNKTKPPHKRCRDCYMKQHKRSKPLVCLDCGKPLHPKSSLKTKRCKFCWIKSRSTKFKEPDFLNHPEWDFGNWLAGFTDGEGNFSATDNHSACFRINLREDDKPILEEIKEQLGCGRIFFLDKSRYNSNQRDQYQFTVSSLYDLIHIIIPFFDLFDLRAKKKSDYLRWREKVLHKWKEVMRGV